MRMTFVLALILGACAGDEVDEGNGPVCTKVHYDKCNSEHDCDTNECHNFLADGLQVCTSSCSVTVPCPDNLGVPVACDVSGYCKPAAATQCRVTSLEQP